MTAEPTTWDVLQRLGRERAEAERAQAPRGEAAPAREPDPELEQMKKEADLLALIRADTGEQGEQSGGIIYFRGRCPVCGHNDDLRYYPDSNEWACFSASNRSGKRGGTIVDYLMASHHMTKGEAVTELRCMTGHPRPERGGLVAIEGGRAPGRRRFEHNKVGREILDRYRARKIDGALAFWDGGRWRFGLAPMQQLVRSMRDEAKLQDVREVLAYVADQAGDVESAAEFDGIPYVQFSDRTVNGLALEAVEPTPDMLIYAALPVRYSPDAPEGLADRFLGSLAKGDPQVAAALCEGIGACMANARAADQALMLIGRAEGRDGTASNGKSTYITFLRSILGAGNVSALGIKELGAEFKANMLLGKLANLGDDIPADYLNGETLATFKKVVTGEAMHANVKYQNGFDFRPQATQVFSMNEVPRLGETSGGVFRRLAFVPFRNRYAPGVEGYDPGLAEKLARPEVLERGALLGLQALPRLAASHRFTEIPGMAEEVERAREENDSVYLWVQEASITAADLDGRRTLDVQMAYSEWCGNRGLKAFGVNRFTERAAAYVEGVEVARRRHGGGNPVATFIAS